MNHTSGCSRSLQYTVPRMKDQFLPLSVWRVQMAIQRAAQKNIMLLLLFFQKKCCIRALLRRRFSVRRNSCCSFCSKKLMLLLLFMPSFSSFSCSSVPARERLRGGQGAPAVPTEQMTLTQARQEMRKELEEFKAAESARRPDRIRPPLRGSRELLAQGFVEQRRTRFDGVATQDDALRPYESETKADTSAHVGDKSENIAVKSPTASQEAAEEQLGREEQYVGHNLDRCLAHAAYAGNITEIDELVRYGASVNRWLPAEDDRIQPNALAAAAGSGNRETVLRLIELGADPNRSNPMGFRALHFAVFSADVSVCKALVDRGADLGAVDAFGDQAVDRAEVAGKECEGVYSWMLREMQRRNITRVCGNDVYKCAEAEDREEEVEGGAYEDALERERRRVEERRMKEASAQQVYLIYY
jgi:hypothetical protein